MTGSRRTGGSALRHVLRGGRTDGFWPDPGCMPLSGAVRDGTALPVAAAGRIAAVAGGRAGSEGREGGGGRGTGGDSGPARRFA